MPLQQLTSKLSVNVLRVLDVTVNSDNNAVVTLHYDGGTRQVTAIGVSVTEATQRINQVAYGGRR